MPWRAGTVVATGVQLHRLGPPDPKKDDGSPPPPAGLRACLSRVCTVVTAVAWLSRECGWRRLALTPRYGVVLRMISV
ncbi:hypothetical protein MRX96_049341 [Rhipicephalus microplus]